MAWALNVGSHSSQQYVQTASLISIPSSTPFNLEFKMRAVNNGQPNWRVFGKLSTFDDRCYITDSNVVLNIGGNKSFNSIVGFDRYVYNTYKFSRNASNLLTLSVNGVVDDDSYTTTSSLDFDVIFTQNTATQSRTPTDFQYLKADVNGVDLINLDATASDHGNTGLQPIIVDIVGSNDATGVNFPTDGSAWEDLGGGGVTGTVAITMSSFTSAGSGNIGEAITGTVSELMDDLIINGSGSVGDNPTGTISITMGNVSVSAVGNIGEAITGTSSILIIDATVVAAGNIGEAVSGTASIQADDFTIAGEGTFALAVTGTVNIQMDDFTIQGRESQGGGIYGAISVIPIEIMELNAEPIEVITK